MADESGGRGSKASRRAAYELIGSYHREQLRLLFEHVRQGLGRLDAGDIDEFELDDLIYHYKRSAAELWKFCEATGSRVEQAASTLMYLRDRGEEPQWWERGRPRSRDRQPPSESST